MSRVEPKILHEDDHLLAVGKPAGLVVHAEVGRRSLVSWARARESAAGRDPEELLLVHRLDRDTSGVVLFARSKAIAGKIGKAFRERRVLKLYLALTWPCPSVRWVRSELQLKSRRIKGGERMIVVEEDGREADSEIEVLARGRRFGFVRVIPEQGRKHQVRVALAEIAAPIVGDFIYGGRRVAKMAPRIMLHARGLELKHPATGKHLALRAPIPADMRELFESDGALIPSRIDIRNR